MRSGARCGVSAARLVGGPALRPRRLPCGRGSPRTKGVAHHGNASPHVRHRSSSPSTDRTRSGRRMRRRPFCLGRRGHGKPRSFLYVVGTRPPGPPTPAPGCKGGHGRRGGCGASGLVSGLHPWCANARRRPGRTGWREVGGAPPTVFAVHNRQAAKTNFIGGLFCLDPSIRLFRQTTKRGKERQKLPSLLDASRLPWATASGMSPPSQKLEEG